MVASAIGQPDALARATTKPLLMVATMTVAMALWMRLRGHRPRLIAEMAAGMDVPKWPCCRRCGTARSPSTR